MGRETRIHRRSPSHRPLAWRPLTKPAGHASAAHAPSSIADRACRRCRSSSTRRGSSNRLKRHATGTRGLPVIVLSWFDRPSDRGRIRCPTEGVGEMTDQDNSSYVIVGSEGLQSSDAPHDHPHGDMVDVRLRDGMVHYQTGEDVGGVTYRLGRGGALLIESAKGDVVTVFGPAAWTWVTGTAAKGKV